MKRHQQILAGVLVIQLLLSIVTFWPRAAAGPAEPLFPGLSVAEITRLRITDDTGLTLTLARRGEAWVLADADDYPANATAITSALEKLVALHTGALATETGVSHAQLRVAADDFIRRVEFETASGVQHTLYLGTAPRYTAAHFRVEGDNKTYLAQALNTWELSAEARSWIDTAYVNVAATEATEITLKNAHGTFRLIRAEDATWTLADLSAAETVSVAGVGAVTRNATQVTLQTPLGKIARPEYGLDSPLATVTVNTPAGAHTLTVGALDAETSSYVVKASDSEYYVRVAEYGVSALVNYARADFLENEVAP